MSSAMKVLEDPISTPRKLLKTFGFWRGRNSSSISLVTGVVLHLLFVDIYLTLQLIYILKLKDVAELSNLLKMCLTYVALFVKSINFVMKFGEIVELENSLEGDGTCNWQHCSNDKSKPYVNRIRKIFYALWISSLLTVSFGAVAVVLNRSERKLPDKMWIPFDYLENESRFLLVALYQITGAFYACTINTALDIYLLFILSALTTSVTNLGHQLSASGSLGDLKASVKKHQRIRESFKRVDFIFSPVVSVQAGCSAVVLCTTAFSLSKISLSTNTSTFLRFFMYLLPMVMQIFLPCFFFDELSRASETLSSELFHSNWPDGDKAVRLTTKVVMENLRTALKMKMLRFLEIDVETFVKICRFSYSVYAVLQSLN